MSHVAVATGRQLWASEQRTARRLGCELQVRSERSPIGGFAVYARLTPTVPRTREAFLAAAATAGELGRDAIEARQSYEDPRDVADAISRAIHAVLDLARAALG